MQCSWYSFHDFMPHLDLENMADINRKKMCVEKKLEEEVTIAMLDVEAKVAELEIIISESYVLRCKGKAVLWTQRDL